MRISDWSSDVCSSDLDRLSVIDAEVVYAVVSDMGADADVTPEPMAPSVLDDAEELADMPAAAPLAADPAVSEEVASLRAEVEALRAARPDPAADLLEEIASLRAEIDTLRAENDFARSAPRSEEHTSELQSLMRTSYAVFC